MPDVTLTVQNKVGLHARPAALFVQTASKFKSDIKVTNNDRTANAKSILGILTLGVHQNCNIKVEANGEDADLALTALKQLVDSKFGEAE
ncbi:MAG: HPr family phosphocarrier protein [Chloroflexi bacterium]|jgi:phosphocarrier protein HPr|nr:HPr family phosphocarrier protein [Anaerolineaceae bacterium]NMB86713.1 HPr family phosphocarrier protein [Chloroflexota bacterium]